MKEVQNFALQIKEQNFCPVIEPCQGGLVHSLFLNTRGFAVSMIIYFQSLEALIRGEGSVGLGAILTHNKKTFPALNSYRCQLTIL